MQGSSSLTYKLMNEDEITDNLLFHCSVCDVCFSTKDDWIPHASGRAHISKEVKKSNIRFDAKDIRYELIARSTHFIGSQKKFVKVKTEESLCTFSCILCDIEMTSYFALSDHLEHASHEMKVHEYRTLKAEKKELIPSSYGKAPLKKSGMLHMEARSKVDRSTCKRKSKYQSLKKAVEEVSKFFTGTLQCVNCQQSIFVDPSTIADHLRDCFSEEDQEKSVPVLTNNIRDRLHALVQDAATGNTNSLEELQLISQQPMSAATYRYLQADATRVSITKPLDYECLQCDMTGSVNKWEKHVTKYHVSSTKLGNDREPDSMVCLCTLCQLLIFGQREDVLKHEHFAVKNGNFFFLFSSHPHLKNVLDCNHQLPKYYKCSQIPAFVDCTKLAFYCLSCDFYGIEKPKHHFQSKNHQLKNYLMFEFYYCAVCSILFYADRLLFEDHRQTPAHILSKFAMKPNVIRASVDFVSKRHEELLSNLKAGILEHWNAEPWNIRYCFAFWCESCAYFTDKKDEWHNVHLTSETHAAQKKKECFEHMCVLCKMSLFGSGEFHAAHCSSEGHKNIKKKVFRDLNRRQIRKKRSSMNPDLESSNEEQMTSSATKINDESSDDNEDDNSEPNHLFKRPTVPSTVPVTCNEKCYDLESDPYLQKLDCSVTMDQKLVKEFFEKIIERRGPFGRVKNYFCAFCCYYSSEKSWWSHLKSQEHKTTYLNQIEDKKAKYAIIFCSRCSFFGFGDMFVRKIHTSSKSHKKMSVKATSTKNVTSSSSPISLLSTTDDDDENFAVSSGIRQTKPICASTIDTADVVNASSDSSDDEQNEVQSAEDELYDMIMREGSDMEKAADSDDELDKSVLEEVKSNALSKMNAAEGPDEVGNRLENRANVENVEYSIVVSGIPKPVMKNRALLREAFSKYVQFDRTFVKKTKPDSIYLVVSKDLHGSFRRLKDNIAHLMARWGTDELTVQMKSEEKSESSVIKERLLEPAALLFSNRREFLNAVTHMIHLYDVEANSPHAIKRINELLIVISRLANYIYREYNILMKTHVFGSRVTGLAVENSDVDVYLQIGASFRGLVSNNVELQQQLVVLFSKQMRRYPQDFCNITSIPFARVPIVKFKYNKSNLNCDLSFKSGLSTMNSMLVRTYLELDGRIKFIVCAVKLWMKLNELADRNLFTTYAQIWMVLFFLMQADIAVVPTVIKLKNMLPLDQQILTVEGWNCSFPNIRNIVWRSSCTLSAEELVQRFFVFYSDISLGNYVLCTLTGLKIEKKHFLRYYDSLPETFRAFQQRITEDPALFRKIMIDFESFCVQDPFDHCHNLTKTINVRKFIAFVELCKETAELLK